MKIWMGTLDSTRKPWSAVRLLRSTREALDVVVAENVSVAKASRIGVGIVEVLIKVLVKYAI